MVRNQRDEPIANMTMTNRTADLDIDCDAAVAVIGDGLGNLVEILQDAGFIGGTTA